ncbi:hypothetical protein KIN20_034801 [Parelaphostrongylus tenuis]|uniref:Transmembrane protein n=1 Tax=Parelaphostrongylus tenuis TaxID=148309 RepID=A0AAD5WKC2_PARTN|nr:hypothetical protein KIN20_034801 [Parelaphostrongylus tenuis]
MLPVSTVLVKKEQAGTTTIALQSNTPLRRSGRRRDGDQSSTAVVTTSCRSVDCVVASVRAVCVLAVDSMRRSIDHVGATHTWKIVYFQMLSTLTPRLVFHQYLTRIVATRSASGKLKLEGKQTLTANPDEGFLKYERDISRDKRYANPPKPGDTPVRFLVRKLHHAYEIYPIILLSGVWFVMFCYIVYHSFSKVEIWIDRSKSVGPLDWERLRNDYWKKPTLLFDKEGVSHTRLEMMEVLQDEMLAAAKARGTR